MYTPVLDPECSKPLYIALYESLRRDLISGHLASGERLPSKRLLASILCISINTVDSAYQQLVSEGYLFAREKSGFYVCYVPAHIARENVSGQTAAQKSGEAPVTSPAFSQPAVASPAVASDLAPPAASSAAAPEFVPASAPEFAQNAGLPFIDFSPNGVDLSMLPMAKIKKVIRDVFEEEGVRVFSSCSPSGSRNLQNALCKYLRESRGLLCRPDQIILGAGTDYILQLLVQILRSMHDINAVAMENPVYNKAYQIFTGLDVPVELIPLDKHGIHMESLSAGCSNLVYTTPSHQFPLGIIMPVSRRNELLAWASETANRYIIEDDYDSEFRYAGRPIPSICSLDAQKRVIYLGTFSKSIAPSVRISYLVVPPDLLSAFQKNLSYYNTTITHPDQLVLAKFIENGDFERHINRMRTLYRKKRDLFLSALSPYGSRLQISGTDAGLHLLCHVKNGMTENELVENAKNAAAKVYGISSYYLCDTADPSRSLAGIPKSTVLLGYASLSDDQILRGAAALAKAWQL